MTTTWWARGAARSRRCSASSTVVPRSALRRPTAARTSSAPWGSSCDVGSSRTSAWGAAARAPAIAARWRSPPDSVLGERSRRCAMPSASSASSTRRRMTTSVMPRFSSAKATSCSTRSTTNCASGSWATNPTTSASSRGVWVRVSRPNVTTRPGEAPAGRVGHQPVGGAQQRALARARVAHEEDDVARGDVEVDPEQRVGPVRVPEPHPPERDRAHVTASCLGDRVVLGADDRPSTRGRRARGAHSASRATTGSTDRVGQRSGLATHVRLSSPVIDRMVSATGAAHTDAIITTSARVSRRGR